VTKKKPPPQEQHDEERFAPDRPGRIPGFHYPPGHSIRVNDQYRILFHRTDAGAMDIVIDDYHN
jgi:hypothetical protein